MELGDEDLQGGGKKKINNDHAGSRASKPAAQPFSHLPILTS
jgi:hypothetical protein